PRTKGDRQCAVLRAWGGGWVIRPKTHNVHARHDRPIPSLTKNADDAPAGCTALVRRLIDKCGNFCRRVVTSASSERGCIMIFGMTTLAFTLVHVMISLVGIVSPGPGIRTLPPGMAHALHWNWGNGSSDSALQCK